MIAIVDYRAGNLTSVQRALTHLGIPSVITNNKEQILNADRVIFPGVGAARSAIENIKSLELDSVLKEYLKIKKPFLGICIGCQIILSYSQENDTECLNLVEGHAILLENDSKKSIRIPHIGWNQLNYEKQHPLFKNIPNQSDFYFNHSYFVSLTDKQQALGITQYGKNACITVLQQDNLIACQFHPEKSGRWGLQFLQNFSQWTF